MTMITSIEDLAAEARKMAGSGSAHLLLVFVAHGPARGLQVVLTASQDARDPAATFAGISANVATNCPVGSVASGWEAMFAAPATRVSNPAELNAMLDDMARRVASGRPIGPDGVPFACFGRNGKPVQAIPQQAVKPKMN